jgi:hypothetical protein
VLGEAYDYDGLIVTAYYNNETSEEVTELCSFVPAEGTVSDTDGTIPVTVSYTHNDVTKDATFDLNVLVLDYIEVTTMPTDTEFTEEDPYDYDGLVITASTNANTAETLLRTFTTPASALNAAARR